MNDYITYCAQAKLLRLIKDRGAASIKIQAHPGGSISIEPSFSKRSIIGDVLLNVTPRIYTDLFTVRQLTTASIDFDYPSSEFIIRRAP